MQAELTHVAILKADRETLNEYAERKGMKQYKAFEAVIQPIRKQLDALRKKGRK